MKIAVLTPTVEERAAALEDCKESVHRQTAAQSHFIGIDRDRQGCGIVRNALERIVPSDYDWLAFLDDDDLMLPDHLATLATAATGADIVYSDCYTEGWAKSWTAQPFDLATIRQRNYIPVTVLMRRGMFQRVGGFRSAVECAVWPEDWDLWLRCAAAGAVFRFVDRVTWVYRRVDASMLVRGY